MYQYQAFNIVIQSELLLPYLPTYLGDVPDNIVSIIFGKIDANEISNPLLNGLCFQASRQLFRLSIPHIANFLIRDGNTIIIEAMPNADEDSLRTFVTDMCLGIVLMQRNAFILRGGVVKLNEQGILLLSATGMGLSTLMAAMLKRGYAMLTDKLCAIDETGYALPGLGCIELYDHVAQAIDFNMDRVQRIRPPLNKYLIPAVEQHYTKPLKIKAIYTLNFAPDALLQCVKLAGPQKMQYLQQAIYKPHLHPLVDMKTYFQRCIKLANQTEMISVLRNAVEYPLDKLVHAIEEDWHRRGWC